MTTKFKTKYSALMLGLYYTGRTDIKAENLYEILHHPAIRILNRNIAGMFGDVHEDCITIEFINSKKIKVCMATTRFRDSFDLWLILDTIGGAIRV